MRLRICLSLALPLFVEGLFGQEYRGSLSGRVLDPSGAAVPGAHLTPTNTATTVRLTTHTNAERVVHVVSLPGVVGDAGE
jgi:hypothetical protein